MKRSVRFWVGCVLLLICCSLVWGQQKPVPYKPPEDVAFRKATIISEGTRLAAEVFIPKGNEDKPLPTIIMTLGWGGTAKSLRPDAVVFARAGYFVVIYDYRGWGESDGRLVLTGTPTKGKRGEPFTAEVKEVREIVDPLDQTTDLQNVIHWVHGEKQCDTKRIGLWGTSYGGGHVIYTASRDPRIKALVAQVPGMDSRFVLAAGAAKKQTLEEATKRTRGEIGYPEPGIKALGTLVGAPIRERLMNYAPIEEVSKADKCAMLIIMAENEEYGGNKDNGIKAFERAKGPKKQVTIPKITHYGVYKEAREQVQKLAVEWFDEHLKALADKGAKGDGQASEQKKPRFPDPPDATNVSIYPEAWKTAPIKPATSAELDALLAARHKEANIKPAPPTSDEQFLRRLYLDVAGKLPSVGEVEQFVQSTHPEKRAKVIDQLLDSEDFSHNLARNWRDIMTARATAMQFFILFPRQYALEHWLFEQFQARRSWAEISRALLSAEGEVRMESRTDDGQVTFLLNHFNLNKNGPIDRANDTARVFLGIDLRCAQCHDAPFDIWKRQQFHELSAFFGRLDDKFYNRTPKGPGKPNWVTALVAKPSGEYQTPDQYDASKLTATQPRFFLSGQAPAQKASDHDRRQALADYVTAKDNYYFAAAFVNRVWGDLMGQAFVMPVDNLGPLQEAEYPELLVRLAASFRATDFDVRALYRTLLTTRTYQREFRLGESTKEHLRFAAAYPARLRADTLLDSLICAVGSLDKQTAMPGMPKIGSTGTEVPATLGSTVKELFQFDSSLAPDEIEGSVPQALMLMNNAILNAQMKATGNTALAGILKDHPQDDQAIAKLYLRVLARRPTARELQTCREHIKEVGKRETAYEDLLWSLINSTEFRTRR